RSIIGRFLEHTRVYYFLNGGKDEIYAGSADLMERNLLRRVETAFPVESNKLKDRMKAELEIYMKDNTQAWILQPDGSYVRAQPGPDDEPVTAQSWLLERLAASSGTANGGAVSGA
ncbi:MAG: RNA degradosome polyphosphate kinase, partial [Pseudomonadota bacterium]|nr:RNA degradosome polyphosphate kinase [Pseudomonadota bacterium]